MKVKPCGRIDDHMPHDWQGIAQVEVWRPTTSAPLYVDHHCPGHTAVEGGAR